MSTESLEGFGCKLSPFGTYNTRELCATSSNCGARWRCARSGGENDVAGTYHEAGTPLIVADGTFNTAEECICYTCDTTGGGCVATDGVNGTHNESTCGNACEYGYKVNASGECTKSLDAVGVSLEQCEIQDTNKTTWGYGCFSKFACRYDTCVGIPDGGENGPRDGEAIYASMEDCTCAKLECVDGNPMALNGSACLFPGLSTCNPLPGTWQMWRVNVVNLWNDVPVWSATLARDAVITWQPPVVQTGISATVPSIPKEYPQFADKAWRDMERLWYNSDQQHIRMDNIDGVMTNTGTELYPMISIGFRRIDLNTVEAVLLPSTYTTSYDADSSDVLDVSPDRGQGVAVVTIHAPANECFVMRSLDFHGEFTARSHLLNMRLSPRDYTGDTNQACVQGTLNSDGGCDCNELGHGDSCEYTCIDDFTFAGLNADGYPICE